MAAKTLASRSCRAWGLGRAARANTLTLELDPSPPRPPPPCLRKGLLRLGLWTCRQPIMLL